ncbi:MAG: ERF family protein [Polaromonas sp.]|nr:ERF family protein [Polaromonas sp.]
MKHIAAALLKAKQAFGPALKSKVNPAFKSKYADLAACLDAVDQPCLANGIVLYQETFEDPSGVTVETVFLHESGESLRCGKLHVPASRQDPQGYGSALSYARRYSLMTAAGIAAEDDDGNAAQRKGPDVAAILRGISGSTTLDVLRANYDAAISMLDESHHPAVQKATATRKKELNS